MSPSARWGGVGALFGAAACLVALAPARWLAQPLATVTAGRVQLHEAGGTVWRGDARLVLSGGAGSRDALLLPGRMGWALGWADGALRLTLTQPCCLSVPLPLRLEAGLGRLAVALPPDAGVGIGQWPAGWLAGLGTPWNTLQPSGTLRLSSPGIRLEWVQGRLRLEGGVVLDFTDASSRLSTLPVLGSYRVAVQGAGAGGDVATLRLSTLDGPLRLSGEGQWTGPRLRLRGEARADTGHEAVLANLMNLLGRRDGERVLLSIG
jgi:general secretion pathway protein N